MLKRAISASGARYINEDSSVTFWNKGNTAFIREGDSTTYKNCVQNGHDDLVNLKSYQAHDLQFRYPKVLKLSKKAVKDTAGWSYESTAKGRLIAQFRFDTSAQPKTNLSAATFTIGRSKSAGAVQECMATPQGRMTRADSLKRSGITYVHSRYSDAGAGNYYEINRYRTLQANSCFSIEEMVHSTNIHNYPPERGITAYDSARVWKALDVAWQTFRFDR